MADVVFITPNIDGYIWDEPIGTLTLATILRKSGVDVDILQFRHFGNIRDFELFLKAALDMIMEKKPKIVSFYTRCDTYHISLKIAQQIKEHYSGIYVVFGGPQADLSATDTLQAVSFVDYICCGEGETTIVPFFKSLILGVPDHTVCGLAYRRGGEVILNPRPEMVKDLDELPAIDYDLMAYNQEGWDNADPKFLFPVDVGRGCPFSCTFCSTKTFWGRKYRLKSSERIIEDIKDIHNRFGVTNFNFVHDMFTMNRRKVLDVCRMLKEIGFPISWRCSARVDCLDNELIDVMVDSGMKSIFMGIETGSPRMQKLIQKNLKLNDVYEKLAYISQKGVEITASFIYGFPHETEEDLAQTIELMLKLSTLPRIVFQEHLCAFFSGTELTHQYIDQIERSSQFSDVTKEIAVSECEDLIVAHPKLFPHFFEYKTEFREKIQYYPQFFRCFASLRSIYDYIARNYYLGSICQMLYDFSEKNEELLNSGITTKDLLLQDRFIDSFCDDRAYEILKEVYRFLLWKMDVKTGSTEVFGFDVKALLNGSMIEEIKPAITAVLCIGTAEGNKSFKIMGR